MTRSVRGLESGAQTLQPVEGISPQRGGATGQGIAQALGELSPPELGALWRTLHNHGQVGALVPVENELIRRARRAMNHSQA